VDLKRVLPFAVIGVAVLTLIAYAFIFKPTTEPIPSSIGGQAGVPSQPSQPSQMPPQNTVAPLSNEPVSSSEPATIVPEGTELKDYCEQYYAAWKNGDFQTAYEMQPLQKKEKNDVNGFTQSLQSYGMVAYTVGEPQIDDNICALSVSLDLGQNGIWKTDWTFIKNDKGQWTVQDSRTGMSQ